MQPNDISYAVWLNEVKQNEIKMYLGLSPKNGSCTVALCFCLTAIHLIKVSAGSKLITVLQYDPELLV